MELKTHTCTKKKMCTTLPAAVLITAKKEHQPTGQLQVIGQKIYTYGLFTPENTIQS